jgi:hypothetical protein
LPHAVRFFIQTVFGMRGMKIFFSMRSSIYLRNFESLVRLLAARGHEVHLAFAKIDPVFPKSAIDQLSQENANIRHTVFPNRNWLWRRPAEFVRRLQTYVRFLDARYRSAPKLTARAESLLPAWVRCWLRRVVGGEDGRRWAVIDVLRCVERAFPPDPFALRVLRRMRPELFLITPLIDLQAKQLDWLKAARLLGIPSGLCVASWDNLTNKSLIQWEPDRVFVWNEMQKQEAVELHRIPSSKVVVTGAQCYDRLFAHRPSMSKRMFLEKVGLEPETPYLLYLCSSGFIASHEVGFVSRWIERLRDTRDPRLERIGILVRPHPENADQWQDEDFSRFENVAVYPRRGAVPIRGQSFNDFYDSMIYSVATVGINTSPMIESGILNKPVFTILAPEFKETQEGTIHFAHLLEGGLLRVGRDLDEHVAQLIETLDGGQAHSERIQEFVGRFVRPHGLHAECTPIFAQALEDLAGGNPTPLAGRPRRGFWIRALLFPWAVVSFVSGRVSEMRTAWLPKHKSRC